MPNKEMGKSKTKSSFVIINRVHESRGEKERAQIRAAQALFTRRVKKKIAITVVFALLGGYCHFKCCSFDGPANENVVHFGLFSFILPGSPSCNSTNINTYTRMNILRSY